MIGQSQFSSSADRHFWRPGATGGRQIANLAKKILLQISTFQTILSIFRPTYFFRQIGDRHIGDLAPDPCFLNPCSVSIYASTPFGNPRQSQSRRVAISRVEFFSTIVHRYVIYTLQNFHRPRLFMTTFSTFLFPTLYYHISIFRLILKKKYEILKNNAKNINWASCQSAFQYCL